MFSKMVVTISTAYRSFTGHTEPEGWRRQHNEELHNLYSSLNIVRV
jgi:hypothetical protein